MTFQVNSIEVMVDYQKLQISFTDANETKTIYFNNKYSINKFLDGLI